MEHLSFDETDLNFILEALQSLRTDPVFRDTATNEHLKTIRGLETKICQFLDSVEE